VNQHLQNCGITYVIGKEYIGSEAPSQNRLSNNLFCYSILFVLLFYLLLQNLFLSFVDVFVKSGKSSSIVLPICSSI
jgi:hypothetical protein